MDFSHGAGYFRHARLGIVGSYFDFDPPDENRRMADPT
jgi:hypothetical protein